MQHNRGRGDEGFTLIELLVVIVILGTLAAVVVFAVGSLNSRGMAAACKSDVKTVEVAVEAYRAQNNAYPTLDQLSGDGGFLKAKPSNPNYTIAVDATNGKVTVDKDCNTLK